MPSTMERLSKLISLADRTEGTPEGELALERAEAMSAELGVELAIARMHAANKEKREEPVADFKVQVNDFSSKPKHRQAMMDLWLRIADAHEIRCTISHGNYLAFCYGFPSDIELAKALFAMLSLRMISEAEAAIKRGDQRWVIDEKNRKIGLDARVYRRNFYEGFIMRVAGRLWTARRKAAKRADETTGGSATIALRSKTVEVDEFYTEKTKHLSLRGSYKGLDNSDSFAEDAIRHGNQAGERADLGTHDKDVSGSNTKALGSA